MQNLSDAFVTADKAIRFILCAIFHRSNDVKRTEFLFYGSMRLLINFCIFMELPWICNQKFVLGFSNEIPSIIFLISSWSPNEIFQIFANQISLRIFIDLLWNFPTICTSLSRHLSLYVITSKFNQLPAYYWKEPWTSRFTFFHFSLCQCLKKNVLCNARKRNKRGNERKWVCRSSAAWFLSLVILICFLLMFLVTNREQVGKWRHFARKRGLIRLEKF